MIRVVKPGLSTTVQGAGRYGYAHLGISPCGAADSLSLRIANLLVGNDQYAPALEVRCADCHLRRKLRLQNRPTAHRHKRGDQGSGGVRLTMW